MFIKVEPFGLLDFQVLAEVFGLSASGLERYSDQSGSEKH